MWCKVCCFVGTICKGIKSHRRKLSINLCHQLQARSQVFSLGGGFWRADASKAAAQRAERASCGRGLGAQPPAGSRGIWH